jgi:acyl phosphate:glycerol-3-phosphate acyltransferase
MHPILISVTVGYLLGSIPFGFILVRVFRGTDVRTTGSGNIGATNVARTSPLLGLATLVLDFLKGLAAVMIVAALFPGHRTLQFVTALAAIAGHVVPVWLRFKGGKGVATGLGSLILLTPKSILVAIVVFVGVMIWFRRVALASISATASLPFLVFLFHENDNSVQFWPLVAGCVLIILKHHQNIYRLLSGTEPKFQLGRK